MKFWRFTSNRSSDTTPQATFGGEFLHISIPAMAAAYLFHLCQNHPFVDGNKRAGANAAITFLLMNNWEPTFEEPELVDLVLSVCFRTTEETGIDRDPDSCSATRNINWLRSRIFGLKNLHINNRRHH